MLFKLLTASSHVCMSTVSSPCLCWCAALPETISSSSTRTGFWQQALLSLTSTLCQCKNSGKQTVLNPHVSFNICGHLFFFFPSRCCSLASSPYCCHCLQPWQQPKTIQGLQQVNIPLDNRSKPDLHCAMLDLDLGQDTSRPPHSMSQTITMHGCSHCWRQLLSLQPCQRLHK